MAWALLAALNAYAISVGEAQDRDALEQLNALDLDFGLVVWSECI
ncbi:hypothetical protein IHE45_17G021600 [Dioscorea alata]|uniref:Uncharacterized protein n=1 Tax=Dioscorea alata TaxID=55571 RepID=A0ACB7UAV6_DIOAL|nr:hypothetical protein IHE45_17G021600 [Dioscorea alata]